MPSQWDLPKVSIMTCLSWSRTVEMKWTINLLQLKRLMPSLCPLYDVSLCEPRDVNEFFTWNKFIVHFISTVLDQERQVIIETLGRSHWIFNSGWKLLIIFWRCGWKLLSHCLVFHNFLDFSKNITISWCRDQISQHNQIPIK